MRRTLSALLALTAIACGSTLKSDGTPTAPGGGGGGANISGVYTLKSVDAKPLPAVGTDSTVLSGLLTVTDSGWSQVIVVRYAHGGSGGAAGDSLPLEGRWRIQGANVIFDDGGTVIYEGSYSTTGFNLSSKTSTFVFSK